MRKAGEAVSIKAGCIIIRKSITNHLVFLPDNVKFVALAPDFEGPKKPILIKEGL